MQLSEGASAFLFGCVWCTNLMIGLSGICDVTRFC